MNDQARAKAEAYDAEAEATGWHAPEVAFGLAFKFVRPGESILDLGIGTGRASELFRKAGLRACGVDFDQEMLDACRTKGFTDLTLHDLTETPYPFDAGSFDHAVCVGTLGFVRDPSPAFREVARILRGGGVFAFAVADRTDEEPPEEVIGPEYTGSGEPVTMYRHSASQARAWIADNGFSLLRSLAFTVHLDRERTSSRQVTAYLALKGEHARPCE